MTSRSTTLRRPSTSSNIDATIAEQTIKHNSNPFEMAVTMVFQLVTAIAIETANVIEMVVVMMFIEMTTFRVKTMIEMEEIKFPIVVRSDVEIKRGITKAMIKNTMIEDTIVEVLTTGTGQVGSTSPQSKTIEIARAMTEDTTMIQQLP